MSTRERDGDWYDEDLRQAAARVHDLIGWLAARASPPTRAVPEEIGACLLEADCSVTQLRRNLGLASYSYLEGFRSEVFGYAPKAFLCMCRLLTAAYLLRDTTRPVVRITTDVGYSSEAYFSNRFREWCGLYPGAFRKLARELLRHSGAAPDEILTWSRLRGLHRRRLNAAVMPMIVAIGEVIAGDLPAAVSPGASATLLKNSRFR